MEKSYKYNLRNIGKIKKALGSKYYDDHIKKSLDKKFSKNVCLCKEFKKAKEFETQYTYPKILVNDANDPDDMQLFAFLGVDDGIVKLAYITRLKG